MKTTRQAAFDALMRVFYQNGYSNLTLDQTLKQSKFDSQETAFLSALFYGVLERSVTLDYTINKYLKKGIASLDHEILVILRMGFYQLCYLDSVPDAAAVNESVELTLYAHKKSAKGLVNAVMRTFLRDKKILFFPEKSDSLAYGSVKYSCPVEILKLLVNQYGEERALCCAKAFLGRPPLFIRANSLKTTTEELKASLQKSGVNAAVNDEIAYCLSLSGSGALTKLPDWKAGRFHVQDLSSQLCIEALAPQPGETVLDVCAAPGSKSFTAAERMEDKGKVYSFDLYESRVKLIQSGAKRLGLSIVFSGIRDAAKAEPILADRVLCDVPCSGLGVIRRKPEIRYKTLKEIDGLPKIQYEILTNAAGCVKPGGRLVYSTCTLNKKENEEVVRRFLLQNNSFHPLQSEGIFCKMKRTSDLGLTLFPDDFNGDGFYIAALMRER